MGFLTAFNLIWHGNCGIRQARRRCVRSPMDRIASADVSRYSRDDCAVERAQQTSGRDTEASNAMSMHWGTEAPRSEALSVEALSIQALSTEL